MAPRRKKRKVRRSRGISLINALESYTYASILSQGIAGTSPVGLLTGGSDLRAPVEGYTGSMTYVNPDASVSLSEIVENPGLALNAMADNAQKNLLPMAVASISTGVAFRFGKRLLRRPIGNINRNIMKPLLGAGIKL